MSRLEKLQIEGDAMPDVHTKLDIAKDELHQESLRAGVIEIVGPLAAPEVRGNWSGGISLDKRLESGELTTPEVQLALEVLPQCYVPTAPAASERCVDGRGSEDYDDNNPEDFGAKLGPQVVAGTFGHAVDHRVAEGGIGDSDSDVTVVEDVEAMVSLDDEYAPGDHTATHHADGKTGCGGVDGVEEHEEDVSGESDEKILAEIDGAVGAMFGDAIPVGTKEEVAKSAGSLTAHRLSYYEDKNGSLQIIVEANPEGVPPLDGEHKEIIVAVNLVPNTTLHRDHFSSLSSGRIQAFGYDAWRTVQKSKKCFSEGDERQTRFVYAQAARSIAALMHLTDGSLILTIRRPS